MAENDSRPVPQGIEIPALRADAADLSGIDIPDLRSPEDSLKVVPIDPLKPTVGAPALEETLLRAEDALRGSGFDDRTVDALVRPGALVPSSVDLQAVWEAVQPTFEQDTTALVDGYQLSAQLGEEGIDTGPLEWSALRQMAKVYAQHAPGQVASGLAEQRSWWNRTKREIGAGVARTVDWSVTDFQLGAALLDVFMWTNKKFKLNFVPQENRAEVEALALPRVEFKGKDYATGTTAAIGLFFDRLNGVSDVAAGAALQALSLVPGPGSGDLRQLGSETVAKGGEALDKAKGDVAQLQSALGEHITWTDVGEMNWEAAVGREAVEDFWLGAYRSPVKGAQVMAAMSIVDTVMELRLDPLLIAGEIAGRLPEASRAFAGALNPAKAATVTHDVARTTRRFEDAVDAVKAAEKNLIDVERGVYGRAITEEGATLSNEALETIWKSKEVAPSLRGKALQVSTEGAKRIVAARRQLLNERMWLDRYRDAGPSSDILRRPARRNPEYEPELSVTERYTEQLPAIDRETGQFQLVEVKREFDRPKMIHELQDEMHMVRHTELERNADEVVHWNALPEDDILRRQRTLFGADDSEQAGDAINHMVRTGGIGVDDVTIGTQAPEVSFLPESQMGLIDWRVLDRANNVTKAEREFLGTSGARQFDIGYSTKRGMARQMDIVRRNLGLARESRNMEAIKVYEAELNSVKSAIRGLSDDALKQADKKFVDWLPKQEKGILETPDRFNRWLGTASDRAFRSLYPGGLGLNKVWDTSVGQVFSPLREPQRFYDSYAPDTWDRVHSGYLRYNRAFRSWNEQMTTGAEKAGLMVKRSKWNPRAHFSEFKINQAKNEQLFDLLDAPIESKEWKALAAKADDKLMAFHDEIRVALDTAAEQQGIMLGGDVPYLTGYIRHMFTPDQFHGGARPLEYIGLPRQADVFAGHLLPRTGDGAYPKDTMLALDTYGRAMNRKIHVEPLYDDIINTGKELAAKHKNNFMVDYANDLVSQLQGRPAFAGAKIDAHLMGALNKDGKVKWNPSAIDRALVGLSGMFWAGMLPGNPRYPLMQTVTGIATTAGRFGLYRTMRGVMKMATREGQAEARASGTYDQFLNVLESDFMRKFSKTMTEKGISFGPLGPQTTASTEFFIRGMTFHAAMDMHMAKLGVSTWKEASARGFSNRVIFEALRSSEEVNHMFGALGRSPIIARTIGKGPAVTSMQFLSFIPKQSEELVSQFNRSPGHLAEYMAVSGWLARVSAEHAGIDVTDYVGLGYLPKNATEDLTSPTVDAIKIMMDLASAIDTTDLQGVQDGTVDAIESLNSLIPMFVAWNTFSKAGEQLEAGAQLNSSGDRERPLEMGEFDFINPDFPGLGSALNPSVTGDLGVNAAQGVGGDFFPTITGARAIREKMFRRGKETIINDSKRYIFEARNRAAEMWDLIQRGELAKAQEVEDILRDEYGIVFEGATAFEKKVEAQEISWTLRALMDTPDQLQYRAVQQIQQNGMTLER